MRTWSIAIVVCLGLVACGDPPPPRDEKPTAPAENDPAYQVNGVKGWYLVSTETTPFDETMTIVVTPPAGTEYIDAYIADLPPRRLAQDNGGRHGVQLAVTDVPVGTHEVLLSANGATTAFARVPFNRSLPYYVLVTTDWDFSDPGDQANTYQDWLHRDHPELRMTHFVGPYTFTDPAVSPARQQQLVDWLLEQRDSFDDEIGLHIHPYCHFVEQAGLTCITDQSTVYTTDVSGYTIKLGAYGRIDFGTLLAHAKTLFQQHGLGIPRTFRAGGWTATLETIAALSDQGFIADTSALNWKHIAEEWPNSELYRWNMANWGPIDDTSQPYYPSETDVLTSTAPTLPILEVPDNGVMIDYVSLAQMNGLFDANWDGTPLAAPRTLMMGFHPATPGFSEAEYKRVDGFLDYADLHLASRYLGPVVYITLEDVVGAYPR